MNLTRNSHILGFLTFSILALTFCRSEDDSKSLTVIAAPTISLVDPIAGKVGAPVTITGTNFSPRASENIVKFNGNTATTISFASSSQISVLVPVEATSGPVSVTVGEKTATGPDFTVLQTSLSFNPAQAQVGTVIEITGVGFSSVPAENVVTFNGIEAIVSTSSSTSILAIVPENATTGPVIVTVGGLSQTGPDFVVLDEFETPENFKVAFLGDATVGPGADAVLNLIKAEGAQAVVHAGDLDYIGSPQAFEDNINGILGDNFPYFFCVGNHDDEFWDGPNGYQSFLEARFKRLNITWSGQLGVLSSFSYQGIFFVVSAPDEFDISPSMAGAYVGEQLKTNNAIWRISFWHKNQRLMQIGGKKDEAGWDVYEASRQGGAIIATGHEHSYCRTYEMRDFQNQVISNTSDIVTLQKDDIATDNEDEGRSFAFVSGLGGRSIRDAENNLDSSPWWADVYHSNNGGQYGALFGAFNYNGDASLARFYFKDIDGVERDVFFVRSNLQ